VTGKGNRCPRWIGVAWTLTAIGGCGDGSRPAMLAESLPDAAGMHRPIILVTIDTLRADHLGTYGYSRDTSPNLDALASRAVVFERAYSTAGTTLPAHVSLFSSLYPLQTGVVKNGASVAPSSERTAGLLQEELKALGYETAGFVSATPVKAKSGLAAGMDVWAEPGRGEPSRRASETTDRALAWLETRDTEAFFLWVHYFDPHQPYEPPSEYADLFAADDILVEFQRDRGLSADEATTLAPVNSAYDGEIRFVDAQFARLLAALHDADWYDEATIVVTADHGEGLGQHDRLGHGRVYGETLRVPLIIKFPGQFELHGTRRTEPVSLVDIVPTLVETLGLDVTEEFVAQFEGTNVFRSSSRNRSLYAQRTFRSRPAAWGPGKKFVLLEGRWKLHDSTEAADELYDLRRDPHELENVIEQNPDVRDRMQQRLARTLRRFSGAQRRLSNGEEIPDEILQELRALGYIR